MDNDSSSGALTPEQSPGESQNEQPNERYYVAYEWHSFWWAKDACEVTVPSILHVHNAVIAETKRRYPTCNGIRIKRVERLTDAAQTGGAS